VKHYGFTDHFNTCNSYHFVNLNFQRNVACIHLEFKKRERKTKKKAKESEYRKGWQEIERAGIN